ncbi:hypothetical protein LCGC14_0712870 [marine sediment metagenome]|uniref:Uncharacterized protein n=1 Tax=marine sediment metagenome TaxID=412755 RepID=A0A0F9QZZ2_9ZZZZ
MPEQTNAKRSALLEKLANYAFLAKGEGSGSAVHIYNEEAVEAILVYFNDPEITMAYNEIKDRTDV